MTTPKTIRADNETLAKEVNEEWQDLVETIDCIDSADVSKSTLIEHACRVLWDLWESEDKREAMGWQSFEDLFHPGNEELAKFFSLIEDRITLSSESNRNRFYNLLLIDSDPTFAGLNILQKRHWTPITQFESRISRLKAAMKEPDGVDKLKLAEEIIAPTPDEKKDPDPADNDFELKKDICYWRGKRAIRIGDGDEPLIAKLRSRLNLGKAFFILKKGESKIVGTNDEKTTEVATVLLSKNDPDYQDFVNWLSSRVNIKAVG
jgi:hypothetical protein